MILIITIKDDIHAVTIQKQLRSSGYSDCYILDCDRIATDHRLSWHEYSTGSRGLIYLKNGSVIDIESVDLIWWRRVRADQQLNVDVLEPDQIRLINNDCRGALAGMLEACFRGKWISLPEATDRASNKIYQLSIAKECGFRVPETLISQSVEEVREFTTGLDGQVIVKPVVGTAGPLMYTQFIRDVSGFDPLSFSICPAIYQEYISGTDHIRLNCFGDNSYAAIIQSAELDWRPNLNVPVYKWDVPDSLHKQVRAVLDELGLEMGIIDIKRTPEGEYVWLEVNPQGQFLFLEPLANIPMTSIFADYLLTSLPIYQ